LAPGLIGKEEAGRRVDDVLERGLVQPRDGGLFFVEVSCLVPGGDLGFDLRTGGPPEPRLVAVGADRGIGRRIDTNRAGMPGMEHLPAALSRRWFLRPTRCVRAPVDGRGIDPPA